MKKIYITLFFILSIIYLYNQANASSFEPIKNISWLNEDKCYYKVTWTWANNSTTYSTGWHLIDCNSSVNFWSWWLNVPDWTYQLHLKAEDKVTLWDVKSYTGETSNTKSNKYGITKWPSPTTTYKIDTTPPTCLLKEIRFLAWSSNNQYYHNWKLYYKKWSDASWKFEVVIESDDSNNWAWPNTSKIQKIEFPTILWSTPNTQSFTNSWKVLVTWRYEWSWNYSDNFDILNNNSKKFCFDNAWNSVSLKADGNTKIIFQDWSHTITWLETLILTPDWIAPTVDWITYNPMLNGFKYKSWNDWNWSENILYNTNTSNLKYFAALDNRKIIIPKFKDEWSWLKSFKINIEKFNDKNNKISYNNNLTTYNNKIINTTIGNISHNFSLVDLDLNSNWYRNYDWNIQTLNLAWNSIETDKICDMVWNCISTPTPDFKVVANTPIIAINTSLLDTTTKWTKHNLNDIYNWNNTDKRSNYSDTHTTLAYFKDIYWNSIVPIYWVKELKLNINFENTLWCDQLTNNWNWDCVDFMFKNDTNPLTWNTHNINEKKNFSYTLDNYNQLKNWWNLKIELKSAIPTKNEYKTTSWDSLYWSLTAKLQLKNLNIKVNNKLSYNWIWENSSPLELANSSWNKPSYKWNPIISFDYIDNIYPLVEWQEKSLNISNYITDISKLNWYDLKTHIWTNNFFLKFQDIKLETWNEISWIDNYSIYNNYSGLYPWKWNMNKTNWINSNKLKFIPKTIWWISNSNTNVALYTNLNYKLNTLTSKEIKLPWIQTWFNNYWPYETSHFLDITWTYYQTGSTSSTIVISEIDVRWITQTRNDSLWTSAWVWATTTDNNTFQDFSNISLYDIKTQVKRNVEQLLAWVSNRNYAWTWTISNFNFDSSTPWIKLQNNSVLYLRWDSIINCWNVCNIYWKKTIIVENGNLFIASDMEYVDDNSILGIILIWNTDLWNTSQLRISENITNWVWIVFSEGPVLSVNWNNTKIYNWWNTTNEDLVHQLYWKWSFATRNTVWWSIKDATWVCPYWTPDYNKATCTLDTARWYDLIYLRRYARVNTSYYDTVTTNPMWDWKIPLNIDKKDIKIAGWDSFKQNTWAKTVWSLPKPQTNNFDAPLIIEYDPRIQSNPPLWFTN